MYDSLITLTKEQTSLTIDINWYIQGSQYRESAAGVSSNGKCVSAIEWMIARVLHIPKIHNLEELIKLLNHEYTFGISSIQLEEQSQMSEFSQHETEVPTNVK